MPPFPVHLVPSFQLPLTSEFQILRPAPAKVALRCRKTMPPTLPDTYGSRPEGGRMVVKLPVTVPPALIARKVSPTLATKPDRCVTVACAPATKLTLPLTLMAS